MASDPNDVTGNLGSATDDKLETAPTEPGAVSLTPECFGEKIGDFELNLPSIQHDQGDKGTCTSHATIGAFEAAAAREITDPTAYKAGKRLSTSYAILQSCQPSRSTGVSQRLGKNVDSLEQGGTKQSRSAFFDGAPLDQVAEALILLGRIPYEGSELDEESKKLESKYNLDAMAAARRITAAVELKKVELGYDEVEAEVAQVIEERKAFEKEAKEIELKMFPLEEKLHDLLDKLPKSLTKSGLDLDEIFSQDKKAPVGVDEKLFEDVKQTVNTLMLLKRKVNDLGGKRYNHRQNVIEKRSKILDQINIFRKEKLNEEAEKICLNGRCVKDIGRKANDQNSFDSSRLSQTMDLNGGYSSGECRPSELLKKFMKSACMGIPTLTGLTNYKDGLKSQSAGSADWASADQSVSTMHSSHAVYFKGFQSIEGKKHFVFGNSWESKESLAVPVENICDVVSETRTLAFDIPIRGEPLSETEMLIKGQDPRDKALLDIYKKRKEFFITPIKQEDPAIPEGEKQKHKHKIYRPILPKGVIKLDPPKKTEGADNP